jgi:hypothetical protein
MFDNVVPDPVVTPVPTVCPSYEKVTVPGALVVAVNVTVCPATAGLGAAVTLVVVAVVANAALVESKGATSATELTKETVRTNLDKIMSEVCPRRNTWETATSKVKFFFHKRKIFPILILLICLLPDGASL